MYSLFIDIHRNPTLSYTQKLEQKVEQLEAALAEARKSSATPRADHVLPGETTDVQYGSLSHSPRNNTRVEENGRLPLNDSISLFQTPSEIRSMSSNKTQIDPEMAASLVNSAWRERAYERLADTPVS